MVMLIFWWVLLQCLGPTTPLLDPTDFLSLQSIRLSLSDLPGSNYFATWDFTSDPCDAFAGVFCSGDKIVSLSLGDPRAASPGLSGRLPDALGSLSSLSSLSVVPGKISGPLPPSLSKLSHLRFLGLSGNFISGEVPEELARLPNLRTLDLSYNRLSGKIPPAIGNLLELANVVLCHNRLTGTVPPIRSDALTHLDLKHNELSGFLSPKSLPSSLQYLSLSWNRFEGNVDGLLTGLNQLNYLDLSVNRFTGSIPGSLFSYPITSLQLQRNFFSGSVQPVDPVQIALVDLSHNRLSGSVSTMFSTVENLYLNNNRFTGQVPGSFVDQLLTANIQTLYLQHNYLTGIEINPTAEIPLSSSLCLQYNCMVPPMHSTCPLKSGKQKTRPTSQCIEWRG